MSAGVIVVLVTVALVAWLLTYMLSQKPVTNIQQLIHSKRYDEAVTEADRQIAKHPRDSAAHLHRAEALKLLGRFQEAIDSYRRASDPAAREGLALALAHMGKDLDAAKAIMEETIAAYPQIQEFKALGLAYILLRRGEREEALRLFDDNLVLLQTRFKDDYTDPDPLLAETLWMFGELTAASGDETTATQLRRQAAEWAPGSVWATMSSRA
jgi:tetratricopeptide (TPR) repeat protein